VAGEGKGKESVKTEAEADRAKLIHNEQVKLTANTFNGVALAFLVGGGVATIIAPGVSLGSTNQLLRTAAWILTGFVLHIVARFVLRMLR
jgi:hypothetical protein